MLFALAQLMGCDGVSLIVSAANGVTPTTDDRRYAVSCPHLRSPDLTRHHDVVVSAGTARNARAGKLVSPSSSAYLAASLDD
jgi:hypothetical protein